RPSKTTLFPYTTLFRSESLDSKAGAVLFRAGDEGNAMYIIEQGKVRICVRAKDGHDVTLTELHRGDFFGEMALLGGKPRSADARDRKSTRLNSSHRTIS